MPMPFEIRLSYQKKKILFIRWVCFDFVVVVGGGGSGSGSGSFGRLDEYYFLIYVFTSTNDNIYWYHATEQYIHTIVVNYWNWSSMLYTHSQNRHTVYMLNCCDWIDKYVGGGGNGSGGSKKWKKKKKWANTFEIVYTFYWSIWYTKICTHTG